MIRDALAVGTAFVLCLLAIVAILGGFAFVGSAIIAVGAVIGPLAYVAGRVWSMWHG